jgi:hypothetical protein
MRSRAALGAALVLLAGLAIAQAQPREQFMLGVLRRDGMLIPFASYDGDWSLPWPVSLRNLELPITLDAVPKKWWGSEPTTRWTLWPASATAKPAPLNLSAPMVVITGHDRRLGLRTDFVAAETTPPVSEFPYPKEGLAVGGNVTVEPIATVSKRATAWRDFTTSIHDDIQEAEETAIGRIKAGARWIHPVPREQRRAVFAELEAWYTSALAQPGFGVSYIEAVKKYPALEGEEGCGLETFVSGWVHNNSRAPKPKTTLTAQIVYCDRNGVSYMLPLGRITLNNRTHWVFQISSWEREWYSVVEATPGRVRFVAEYFAGGRVVPF